jgi:hypothetical protein
MTTTEINKKFAELAGIPWHEKEWIPGGGLQCKCGCGIDVYGKDNHSYQQIITFPTNPNYCADPRLVLRNMKDIDGFLSYLIDTHEADSKLLMLVDLILDESGKMAEYAIKYLDK